MVVTCYIAGVDVEWPLMNVIITFTFYCDNLWKSKFMALEKPGKLGIVFLLLCGHPVDYASCGTLNFTPQLTVAVSLCQSLAEMKITLITTQHYILQFTLALPVLFDTHFLHFCYFSTWKVTRLFGWKQKCSVRVIFGKKKSSKTKTKFHWSPFISVSEFFRPLVVVNDLRVRSSADCRSKVSQDPGADTGGVRGVRTPALCLGCPSLKTTYFQNMLFLAEQGASQLMIFEQRRALLINFRIKFNLIFAGVPGHPLDPSLGSMDYNVLFVFGRPAAVSININIISRYQACLLWDLLSSLCDCRLNHGRYYTISWGQAIP